MSFLYRTSVRAAYYGRPSARLFSASTYRQKTATEAVKDAAASGIDKGRESQLVPVRVYADSNTEQAAAKAKEAVGLGAKKAEGTASQMAGEAKGKTAEMTGEAKGKASELAGKAKQ